MHMSKGKPNNFSKALEKAMELNGNCEEQLRQR